MVSLRMRRHLRCELATAATVQRPVAVRRLVAVQTRPPRSFRPRRALQRAHALQRVRLCTSAQAWFRGAVATRLWWVREAMVAGGLPALHAVVAVAAAVAPRARCLPRRRCHRGVPQLALSAARRKRRQVGAAALAAVRGAWAPREHSSCHLGGLMRRGTLQCA